MDAINILDSLGVLTFERGNQNLRCFCLPFCLNTTKDHFVHPPCFHQLGWPFGHWQWRKEKVSLLETRFTTKFVWIYFLSRAFPDCSPNKRGLTKNWLVRETSPLVGQEGHSARSNAITDKWAWARNITPTRHQLEVIIVIYTLRLNILYGTRTWKERRRTRRRDDGDGTTWNLLNESGFTNWNNLGLKHSIYFVLAAILCTYNNKAVFEEKYL